MTNVWIFNSLSTSLYCAISAYFENFIYNELSSILVLHIPKDFGYAFEFDL